MPARRVSQETMQELRMRPYVPSATALKFHASNAFFRGIRGPIGSGKSSTCVAEIMSRSLEQKPWHGVRRTQWIALRNCFDNQTEVLTETRGWKLFRELGVEDKVATRGDAGEFLFAKPTYHYRAPYVGKLITYKAEGVDFCVTPDHKLLVSKKRTRKCVWGPWEFRKAGELAGKTGGYYRVPRTAYSVVSRPAPLSEDWFEFMGYWFAEGCAFVSHNVRRVNLTSVSDHRYTEDLLRRCGIGFWINDGRIFMLHTTTIPEWVVAEMLASGKAITKRVPLWIKEAPAGHLKAFLHGHEVGDGLHAKRLPGRIVCTSSRQLADDLQEIACRAGITANIRKTGPPVGSVSKWGFKTNAQGFTVTYPTPKKFRPYLFSEDWGTVDYAGEVFCVEVPGHRLLVRRGGVTHYSSQTYNDLLLTTLKIWEEWVPLAVAPVRESTPIQSHLECNLEDGTRVDMTLYFMSFDHPDDIRKLKSINATGVWLNEASELSKECLDAATSRCGRFPSEDEGGFTWKGAIADTNSPDDTSWWYDLSEATKPKGYEFFDQPPAMIEIAPKEGKSPLEAGAVPQYVPNDGTHGLPAAENIPHLGGGFKYYEDLIQAKPREWINVFVLNQYGSTRGGKVIYPEYVDALHASKRPLVPSPGQVLYVGWDFGLSCSCVFAQLTARGQLRVLREIGGEDIGIQRFIRDYFKPCLTQYYANFSLAMTGDPAGSQRSQSTEQTCFSVMADEGFPNVVAASTNEFAARREAVAWFLSRLSPEGSAFQLDPSCQILRKGFLRAYAYRKMRAESFQPFALRPDKTQASHLQDALQYLCLYLRGSGYAYEASSLGMPPSRGQREIPIETVSALGWT